MLGKEKCRILKEIRRRIAEENDIPVVTRECKHQGDCRGTCPRCEQELRELERQLALRQSMGKRVAVTALCAGLALGSTGCTRAEGIAKGLLRRPDPPVIEVGSSPAAQNAAGELFARLPVDACGRAGYNGTQKKLQEEDAPC